MTHERSLLDRLLRRVTPTPVLDFAPLPREVDAGLWVLDRRLEHFGLALLPTRTTIVRVAGGGLVVISPPAVVDARCAEAIESIGRVEDVVVPSSFHYLFVSELVRRYPAARVLASPGLAERVPGLQIDAELVVSRPPSTWSGVLDYVVLGPVDGVSEVLFFHIPSGTLILTDLAFNMERYPRARDRLFWRLSGIPPGFGPGRTTRSLLLRDRAAATRALSEALTWPIEQIVVAHGNVVRDDARSRLLAGFRRTLGDLPAV